jgi:hypothetical protein
MGLFNLILFADRYPNENGIIVEARRLDLADGADLFLLSAISMRIA